MGPPRRRAIALLCMLALSSCFQGAETFGPGGIMPAPPPPGKSCQRARPRRGLSMRVKPSDLSAGPVGLRGDPRPDSPAGSVHRGTVSEVLTGFNIAKAIVGAGSFALPWACKTEGVAGGVLTIAVAGVLASITMKSLMRSKDQMERETGSSGVSYVELANHALGGWGGNFVFAMTVAASMGVCSSYVAFIGSTLELLTQQDGTWLHATLPSWTAGSYELAAVLLLAPVTWLKSFEFLSFTSTLGVLAVGAAMGTTVLEGMSHVGSVEVLVSEALRLPLWPQSLEAYSASFGTVIFLSCINFLIFPVERVMRKRENFGPTLDTTLATLSMVNAAFAALGFAFFGMQTSDIVTNNLGSGAGLTAIKTLVCMDLLLTYPLVFSAGREIVERLLLPSEGQDVGLDKGVQGSPSALQEEAAPTAASGLFAVAGAKQGLIRSGLVALTWYISQSNNFGLITNVVGGFAQGSLAFIIPPAVSLSMRGEGRPVQSALEVVLIAFGVGSAGLVSYQALESLL